MFTINNTLFEFVQSADGMDETSILTSGRRYAHCGNTPKVIEMINSQLQGTVLEIGAGDGLIARLLKFQHGRDVIATDLEAFPGVEQLDAVDAVKKYETDTLLLIWPSYDTSVWLKALHEFAGSRVCTIGEKYGCTATDEFYDELKKWERTYSEPITPNYMSVNQYLDTYIR